MASQSQLPVEQKQVFGGFAEGNELPEAEVAPAAARDPKTEKVSEAINEIDHDPELWSAMSKALGLKGSEVVGLLLAIPGPVLTATFKGLKLQRGEGESEPATPIEQGAAHFLIESLRERYKVAPTTVRGCTADSHGRGPGS